MEEFLNDYVQMIADAQDIELTPDEMQKIVNRLKDEEAIWDTVDFYIHQAFDSYLEEVMSNGIQK